MVNVTPPLKEEEKPFGFWTATSLVIGNMIGTGIYFLPAALASIGSISILGYLLTALGSLCLAIVFARLTLLYPRAGGPYAHGRHVFGDWVGFSVAWGYWIMNWSGSAATAVGIVSYLSHFIPELLTNPTLAVTYGLLIVWGLTALNCLGLRFGGTLQIVLTALKLIPVFVIPFAAFTYFEPQHFMQATLNPETSWAGGINAAAILTMWTFIGLESATVPTDKVKNAGRTVYAATLFGTSVVAIIYMISIVSLFGILPLSVLANSPAPFVDAAQKVFGSSVAPFIAASVVLSGIGGLNGWILVHGQIPRTMAKDGLFPPVFAKTLSHGTPIVGLLTGSVLISLLMIINYEKALIDQFTMVITVGSAMTLFAYLVSALAAVVMSERRHTKHFMAIALLGAAYSLWAIYGAGKEILLYCLVGYLIGIPVYVYVRASKKKLKHTL